MKVCKYKLNFDFKKQRQEDHANLPVDKSKILGVYISHDQVKIHYLGDGASAHQPTEKCTFFLVQDDATFVEDVTKNNHLATFEVYGNVFHLFELKKTPNKNGERSKGF